MIRDAMRERLEISPQRYAQVTLVALAALALIVLTGAGGAPDRLGPRLPGLAQVLRRHGAAARHPRGDRVRQPAAHRLRRDRRDRRQRARLLPPARTAGTWPCSARCCRSGVIGQAILGALVVKYHLAPGLVMRHFILSMLLLDAAFALAWCSRYEPGERRRSTDRLGVWAVRALIPLGQLTILAGTIATASGPHAGAHEGELVHRFDFEGADTLEWVVQRHSVIAAIFGIAAIAVWFLLRRHGGDRRAAAPAHRRDRPARPAGRRSAAIQWALELPGGARLGPRRPRHRRPGWRCSGRSRRAGRLSRGARRRRPRSGRQSARCGLGTRSTTTWVTGRSISSRAARRRRARASASAPAGGSR